MKTSLDCIPCFMRQVLETARFITDDPQVHELVVREVLKRAADIDMQQSPPAFAKWIHSQLRSITGVADPYHDIKKRFNKLIMDMLDELELKVSLATDPFEMSLRLAIAGNVIDFGVNGDITEEQVKNAIDNTLNEPFYGDIEGVRNAVTRAKNILYLADNCGEIVFDRLLIERIIPNTPVTVAVRGMPILNDVTMSDAQDIGLCELADVIDNGADAPGTILDDCSEDFVRHFRQADLIIAKGQGNFETLSDEDANIVFLLKAKCPVIAEHLGLPVGTHIAMMNKFE